MTLRLCALALIAASSAASASDLSNIGTLAQGEFHALSEDLAAAFSYKGVTPATSLGITGGDFGFEVSDTRVQNADALHRAGGGSSDIWVPKLHAYKGLPAGFDIGAFVGGAPQLGAGLAGIDLRYAVIEDGLTTPGVALRIAGTRLFGADAYKLTTVSADVMVSKRFALLTPYVGGGTVRARSSVDNSVLQTETFSRGRGFLGANLNLIGANLAFEAERSGSTTTLSAKVGLRF
jgi:hypothetical protein